MDFKCVVKKVGPDIDWGKLDLTRVIETMATDTAVLVRKHMAAGDIKPALKQSTIDRKSAKGSKFAPSTPLVDSGLLHDNIKGGAHPEMGRQYNKGYVFIKDKTYEKSAPVTGIKATKQSWGKQPKGEESGAVTTNMVGYWHEMGLAKNAPQREFFFINSGEYDTIFKTRFVPAVRKLLKSKGLIK